MPSPSRIIDRIKSGFPICLLLCLLRRCPCRKRDAAVYLFMILGFCLLCLDGGTFHFGFGEILAFLSAVLSAASLICSGDTLHYMDASALSFVQAISAVILCAVPGVISGNYPSSSLPLLCTPRNILILLYSAAGCTLGGYLLQNVALVHLSARTAGILQGVYPVCTAMAAFLILQERMTLTGILGSLLILICIWLGAGSSEK